MIPPIQGMRLPFPVVIKPFYVATIQASRETLRASLGFAHYVETDSTRTCGGDEDNWAWELTSGHRVMVVLAVPYGKAYLICDPPDVSVAVASLGIDPEADCLGVLEFPFVDPSYSGP